MEFSAQHLKIKINLSQVLVIKSEFYLILVNTGTQLQMNTLRLNFMTKIVAQTHYKLKNNCQVSFLRNKNLLRSTLCLRNSSFLSMTLKLKMMIFLRVMWLTQLELCGLITIQVLETASDKNLPYRKILSTFWTINFTKDLSRHLRDINSLMLNMNKLIHLP